MCRLLCRLGPATLGKNFFLKRFAPGWLLCLWSVSGFLPSLARGVRWNGEVKPHLLSRALGLALCRCPRPWVASFCQPASKKQPALAMGWVGFVCWGFACSGGWAGRCRFGVWWLLVVVGACWLLAHCVHTRRQTRVWCAVCALFVVFVGAVAVVCSSTPQFLKEPPPALTATRFAHYFAFPCLTLRFPVCSVIIPRRRRRARASGVAVPSVLGSRGLGTHKLDTPQATYVTA
jgi:hypothetical protein